MQYATDNYTKLQAKEMIRYNLFESPKIDQEKFQELDKVIDIIERKIEKNENLELELKRVRELSPRDYEYSRSDFFEYWGAMDKEELIIQILTPNPSKIPELTHQEIDYILKEKIVNFDFFLMHYIRLLELNSNYQYSIQTLILHPDELGYPRDLDYTRMARIIYENEKPPNPKNNRPPVIYL